MQGWGLTTSVSTTSHLELPALNDILSADLGDLNTSAFAPSRFNIRKQIQTLETT